MNRTDSTVPRQEGRSGLGPLFLAAALITIVTLGCNVTIAGRPMVALDTVAFYLEKLISPVHLIFDYGRTPEAVRAKGFQMMWMLPLVAAGLLIWKGRRFPLLTCGCVLSVAGIAPVLGLVPFAAQDYSTVSDHYLYPSMLGAEIRRGQSQRWSKPKHGIPPIRSLMHFLPALTNQCQHGHQPKPMLHSESPNRTLPLRLAVALIGILAVLVDMLMRADAASAQSSTTQASSRGRS